MALSLISRTVFQNLRIHSVSSQRLQHLHTLQISEGLQKNVKALTRGDMDKYNRTLPLFLRTFCRTTSELDLVDNETSNEQPEKKPARAKRKVEIFDVETSVKYMNSKAYEETYGSLPVWKPYRRNHKYAIPPRLTRKTCIRFGHITTGSACPICRDDYLVLHETNIKLLEQFLCPHTGNILLPKVTGICRAQHRKLRVAMTNAWDYGYLQFEVPLRKYDYSEYYGEDAKNMK